MTRQRKEIQKQLDQLRMEESAEYEMSCGFFTSEIAEVFGKLREKLIEKLAATYGKTVPEYEAMLYEVHDKLISRGIYPFG